MFIGPMSSILAHLAVMSKAQRRAVNADVIVRISSSRKTRKRENARKRRDVFQKKMSPTAICVPSVTTSCLVTARLGWNGMGRRREVGGGGGSSLWLSLYGSVYPTMSNILVGCRGDAQSSMTGAASEARVWGSVCISFVSPKDKLEEMQYHRCHKFWYLHRQSTVC